MLFDILLLGEPDKLLGLQDSKVSGRGCLVGGGGGGGGFKTFSVGRFANISFGYCGFLQSCQDHVKVA